MYQITTQTLPKDILDEIIPSNIILRDKLIRKVNEQYQYRPEVFEKVNKGDYSFIEDLLNAHIFYYH